MQRHGWKIAFFLLNALGLFVLCTALTGMRPLPPTSENEAPALPTPAAPPPLAVVSHSPSGSVDAAAERIIQIEFNAPLDPQTVQSDAIVVTPAIPGAARLEGDRTLIFECAKAPAGATPYKYAIASTIRGLKGQRPPPGVFPFETERPRLIEARQVDVTDDGGAVLELRFNLPIAPAALSDHLKLAWSDGNAPLRFSVLQGKPTTTPRVTIPSIRYKSVDLILLKGLTSTEGPLPLRSQPRYAAAQGQGQSGKPLPSPPPSPGQDANQGATGNGDKTTGAGLPELPRQAEGGGADLPDLPPPAKDDEADTDAKALAERIAVRVEVALDPGLRIRDVEPSLSARGGTIRIESSAPIDASHAQRHLDIEPKVSFRCVGWSRGLRVEGDFKPNRRYTLTFKQGLAAGAATPLRETVTRAVWFGNREPALRLDHDGGYLRPSGTLTVLLETVNVQEAEVRIQALYPNNLVEYILDRDGQRPYQTGAEPITSKLPIANRPNEAVTTLLRLRDLKAAKPGLYSLEARRSPPKWSWSGWRRTVIVVGDLGLHAQIGDRQALIWAVRLGDAAPAAGATIQLVDPRRQVIGEGQSDEEGLLRITWRDQERTPALVLARGADGQFSYLNLRRTLQGRGTDAGAGRSWPKQRYEAFCFADRDLFRPGETARLAAFVRDRDGKTPPPMPLTWTLLRPDGKVVRSTMATLDETGRVTLDLPLPRDGVEGTWRARLRLPGADADLGATDLRIASFVPPTLKVALAATSRTERIDEPVAFTAEVRHLYGAPAKAIPSVLRVRWFGCSFSTEAWKDFTFGDPRRDSDTERVTKRGQTNADGAWVTRLDPPALDTPGAIRGEAVLEARERGGRALTDRAFITVYPYAHYLGLAHRPQPIASPGIREGEPAEDAEAWDGDDTREAKGPQGEETETNEAGTHFDVVRVTPSGVARGDAPFTARLLELNSSMMLRENGKGRLVYEWVTSESLLHERQGRFRDGKATLRFPRLPHGRYRVLVESDGACAVRRDLWLGVDQTPPRGPGGCAVRFEADRYPVGAVARAFIDAPFAGEALLTIESDHVLDTRRVALVKGRNDVTWKVAENWRPNVYLGVTLIRPVQPARVWKPHRVAGVARLTVEPRDRRLEVTLDAPKEVRPETEVEVRVRVVRPALASANGGNPSAAGGLGKQSEPAGTPAEGAAVVLYAVDEGVLSLTRYQTPDPEAFFQGPRRLSVLRYDMFDQLAPDLAAWRVGDQAEAGGGGYASAPSLSRRLSPIDPKRFKPVALAMTSLRTDADGVATARFKLPAYLGTLRLMAIAGEGPAFGHAEAPLPVRAPLMVKLTAPRAVAPTDRFLVPVRLINDGDTPLEATCTVQVDEPLALEDPAPATTSTTAPTMAPAATPRPIEGGSARSTMGKTKTLRIAIPAGETVTQPVWIRAHGLGVGRLRVTVEAETPTETLHHGQTIELPVRPAAPLIRRHGRVEVKAGETERLTLPTDAYPGTARGTVWVGGSPVVDLQGVMHTLLRYPHGCAEQTVSRMAPLIYLRDIVAFDSSATGSENAAMAEAAARDAHPPSKAEIEARIEAGVERLARMLTRDGSIGTWTGSRQGSPWVTAFAADMLIEARRGDYTIPDRLLDPMLDYLEQNLAAWAKPPSPRAQPRSYRPANPEQAAYAAYVLTRAGRPPRRWLVRLDERFAEAARHAEPISPQALCHLAMAHAVAGDWTRARALLPLPERLAGAPDPQATATDTPSATDRPAWWRRHGGGALGSPLRVQAIWLSVLLDVDPKSPAIPDLVARLRIGARQAERLTTQEGAFLLMALGKYLRRHGQRASGLVIMEREGHPAESIDLRQGGVLRDLAAGETVTARFSGEGVCPLVWSFEAVPVDQAIPEVDHGLRARRWITHPDGHGIGPTDLRRGELYRVALTIETPADLEHVVVTIPLAGGLELEQADLRGVALADTDAPANRHTQRLRVAHVERRDDRLLLFCDPARGTSTYEFLVRAVTAGQFVQPPLEASCMYDPGIESIHGAGTLEIHP